MPELVKIGPAERDALARAREGVPALDPAALSGHVPDAHWMLLDGARLLARCSAWWQATPELHGARVGAVGHYAALDAGSGQHVIGAACDELRSRGVATAVGPMDGNTWRSYRFVTWRGSEPQFLLEPWQPEDWPAHFTSAGFAPLATYHSALSEDLGVADPRIGPALARLEAAGVAIRAVNMGAFEDELRRIHRLSLDSFSSNFLYTPLEEPAFLQQYLPIRSRIVPELVLVAEHDGGVTGFLFAIPDWNEAQRGAPRATIIVKTVAVAPGRRSAGLGACLVARAHEVGHRLGYTRAVHALMHDANNSANISKHYSRVMRRYTLFARELGAGRK